MPFLATLEEEETPPPPPEVRWPRQPMPDHPPYCWMIGEAIDELGEDGGSAEDSISSFIRAAHPGVPAAHDRVLRHYLAKHVAEGFFVCPAPGRYVRSSAEALSMEKPAAATSSKPARVATSVPQVKRGRGRPRKDGSSSPPPSVKKDGSGWCATAKRRGRRRGVATVASDDSSVPSWSVAAAVADKSGSQETASAPGSSSTPPAIKKDGSKGSATPGRPCGVAPLASGDGSDVPSSAAAAAEKSGSQATALAPRRRRQLRKLATITDAAGEARVTDKEEDGIDVPSTTGKEHGRSLELALVVVGYGSATTLTVDNNVCGEAPPTIPVGGDQPRDLALMTVTDVPAPMPHMDMQDGGETAYFNLAKQDDISGTSTALERPIEVLAADDGPVLWFVADKTDGNEAPSKYKRLGQPHGKTLSATHKAKDSRERILALAATVPVTASGGKTLSATPKAKDRRMLALADTVPMAAGGGNRALSIAPKPHKHNRLCPLTTDEIPDDPSWCVLALPAVPSAKLQYLGGS